MTATPWDETVYRVISEILESTAFTEVNPSAVEPVYDNLARGAVILVHEPVQGELQLRMEKSLLSQLAETVYAPVLGEVNEQVENDFLDELLNTIAGRFLSAILPPEKSLTLGLPEHFTSPSPCSPPQTLAWNFTVDNGNLSFSVQGESLLALRANTSEANHASFDQQDTG